MEPIYIYTEKELKNSVHLDNEVIEAIERGFSDFQKGSTIVPPIMMLPVEKKQGEVDIKSAFIEDLDHMAVKVASGFFKNPQIGLPSASGLMLVINSENGFLDSVLLDNGYLTQVRTGAAGAVAAKYLAPKKVVSAGVIGSGTQARFQMRALSLVRSFNTIYMFSLDSEKIKDKYAEEIGEELGVPVVKAKSVEQVVMNSQVVVTTTPSRKGYINPQWLHKGLHITAMGSDTEEKQELEAMCFSKADKIVCDSRSQVFRLGELRSALAQGIISENSNVIELGEIINGTATGRENENEITICDLTGVGVQDTMIALLASKKAKEKKAGITIYR